MPACGRRQGPSPDEVALVNTARQLGFHFLGRDASNIYLDLQGEKVQFEVLNVLEFSSDRRRMSVIARSPDGTIRLFIKVRPVPFHVGLCMARIRA